METPISSPSPRLNFFKRILDNPVVLKELKGRMRGKQGFVILTVYLMLIGFFISSIYIVLSVEGSVSSPGYLQVVGKSIFSTVVLIELLMISFIAPALTSGAISSERERQTFDLLHISLLSAPALVFGKLFSAVVYLLLLILAAIPVQSLAFFLGGVGAAEMIISTLMLIVTAVFFCALGLFFSSFTKRTLISTVLAYGSNLFSFVVFFFLLFVISLFQGIFSSRTPGLLEDLFTAFIWFLFSTNAFFAAVVSEVILIEDQSIFYTTSSLFGSSSLPMLSPWIIYILFYIFFTALLILLSIYFVRRTEK